MSKEKIPCYFTIEASFLMTLVTLGIWIILMIGFYLYNLCCITEISSITALRGAGLKREERGEIQEFIRQEIVQMMEKKLVLVSEKEQEVIVTTKEIYVKIRAKMTIPIFSLFFEILETWEMKSESKIRRNHPVDTIRDIRKAGI